MALFVNTLIDWFQLISKDFLENRIRGLLWFVIYLCRKVLVSIGYKNIIFSNNQRENCGLVKAQHECLLLGVMQS